MPTLFQGPWAVPGCHSCFLQPEEGFSRSPQGQEIPLVKAKVLEEVKATPAAAAGVASWPSVQQRAWPGRVLGEVDRAAGQQGAPQSSVSGWTPRMAWSSSGVKPRRFCRSHTKR